MTGASGGGPKVEAFWWRPMSGTYRQKALDLAFLWTREDHTLRPPWRLRNFGDELAPRILHQISPDLDVRHVDANRAEIALVGSVAQRVALESRDGTWVIGAGIPGGLPDAVIRAVRRNIARLDVRAVRGPLTASLLGLPSSTALGDPALLLEPARTGEGQDRGLLVAHFGSARSSTARRNVLHHAQRLELRVVSTASPADVVLNYIGNAPFVVSTSLHGIVLADRAGVPAMPLTLASEPTRDLRFDDYGAAVGRSHTVRQPLAAISRQDLQSLATTRRSMVDPALLESRASGLREQFQAWLRAR